MRGDECAVGANEPREHGALVAVLGDARHPAKQQRMVREQQVDARLDRLVDGVDRRVDGEQDRATSAAGSPATRPGASHSSAPEIGQSVSMAERTCPTVVAIARV